MRFRLLLVFVSFLLLAGTASAQTPVARRNPFSRLVRYSARQVKETFTDIRHDPLWATAVIGSLVLEGIVQGQTVYGRNHGLLESNTLFYGSHASTAKIVGLGTFFTVANLAAIHSIREQFTNSCKREAANPDSLWNSGKIDATSYNPDTCKYAGDMLPIIEWAPRIVDVQGNFRVLRNKP